MNTYNKAYRQGESVGELLRQVYDYRCDKIDIDTLQKAWLKTENFLDCKINSIGGMKRSIIKKE